MTRVRLNRPVLAVSLLLPVLSAIADDVPPLFRFAPQWLENHPARTQGPATEPAPLREEETRPPATGREKAMTRKLFSDDDSARASQCKTVVRERDLLIKRLADLQAGGLNAPRPCVTQQGGSGAEGSRAALKASQDANDALIIRAKEDEVAQAEARRQATQSARELAAARAEGLRLNLENKALMLRADTGEAQLTALQNVRQENQRLRDMLAGREKQAAVVQAETRRQAAQSAQELARAQERGRQLGLENKALTLRADVREVQLAELQDVKGENQRLRDALAAAERPGAGTPPRPAASAPAGGSPDTLKTPDTGAPRADRAVIKAPDGNESSQLTGDYAAGVAFGREALSAVSMNTLLGVQTRPQDLASGFTDALLHTIRYPEKALENTLALRRLEVQAARDRVIKTQHATGEKALAAFRREPGVRQDAQGYWYRIETPGTARLSADSTLTVSVTESLAGASATEKESTVRQTLNGFPPLFRSVIEKLRLHGSVTFLVPPALAWGDDGFPPRIPPGTTMVYRLTVTGQEKPRQDAADHTTDETGQRYLDAFTREPGVKKSPRGFWYQIIEAGNGTRLHEDDRVTTVMRESLAGGRVINDMVADKQAVTLPLNGYPSLFREAILLLSRNGAIRLVVPAGLAYGSSMPDGVRPDSVMVYDIRIVSVEKGPQAQKDEKPKAVVLPGRKGAG